MTIRYRDGRPGDGAAISDLFCEAFTATFGHIYAEEDLASFLCELHPDAFESELANPDYAFRLAHDGETLAGYIKLGPDMLPIEKPDKCWEIYQLYLAADYKGKGIAQCLMDWGLDEARARGFSHAQLTVYIDNHRARRFYEKYGFEEVGQYSFMVGNHEDDDRIMRLAL